MDKTSSQIYREVDNYYTEKLNSFGATPAGVDWNSQTSQWQRFRELTKIIDRETELNSKSILDYGCGYGALRDYLVKEGLSLNYQGFDLSEAMISTAIRRHADLKSAFTSDLCKVASADYVVASGIFSVKQQSSAENWRQYIIGELSIIDGLSKEGFAFNMLTSYSEPSRMREDLYYADPCVFFDYCKQHFSRHVALIHDYGLYEFTLLVRKSLNEHSNYEHSN